MANQFLVSAVQMVSTDHLAHNLQAARRLVLQAAGHGSQIVVLPEYFCLLSSVDTDKFKIAEVIGIGPIQSYLSTLAQEAGVFLVAGTVPIWSDDGNRITNSQLVFAPTGERLARYDKIHLFSYRNEHESYDEARSVMPGSKPVRVELPSAVIGLSTCYDLRFPELYRLLGPVDLLVMPAAFTATTGKAHWEPLIRARAIENQAFMLAAAQGGEHSGGRRTWGHSMLVDPWGEIIAEMELGEGVLTGQIDLDRIAKVRSDLPALNHRVLGLDTN